MSPLRWTLFAAILGFTSSALFSSVLGLGRVPFVAAHGGAVLAFFGCYLFRERVNFGVQLRRRWLAGVAVGLVFGAALVRTVFAQPSSTRPTRAALAFALGWHGLLYGVVDALLLSVLPVLVVYGARPREELQSAGARWRWALAALGASLLITGLYHWGFREFRGPALAQPLIGNAMITVSYLLAGNPLAPIVAHVLMHGAAVWHGMAATVQLPPHY